MYQTDFLLLPSHVRLPPAANSYLYRFEGQSSTLIKMS
jgi:hypothetical protein